MKFVQNLHNSMTRMMDAEEAGITVIGCQGDRMQQRASKAVEMSLKVEKGETNGCDHFTAEATANSSSCHLHSISNFSGKLPAFA
jgi:hypothetical protein